MAHPLPRRFGAVSARVDVSVHALWAHQTVKVRPPFSSTTFRVNTASSVKHRAMSSLVLRETAFLSLRFSLVGSCMLGRFMWTLVLHDAI
jgi:hypothetical protein